MKSILMISIFGLTFVANINFAQAAACSGDKQKAEGSCSEKVFKSYENELIDVEKKIKGMGAGAMAENSRRTLGEQKAMLESQIAQCKAARDKCAQSCTTEAANNRSAQQEGLAQQNDKDKKVCEEDLKKKEDNAKGTSNGMAEAMQALGALMQALGMQSGDQQQAETPLCTQNPNDPQCKTDTATTDGGSTLATGEFRRDDGPSTVEGDLGLQADPTSGPAAQATQAAGIAGAGSAGLGGGGGGGNSSPRGRDSGDKKSDFDGSPKINLAGGAMGGGGGGGGSARGAGTIGKGGGNPTASRTSIDGESQAGKIAAAADERLRGPASNEPLGGISSVYYLDNFSKVEKRMTTERNTLQEH